MTVWTPEIEARAKALHAEGRGSHLIANELDISVKLLKRRFKRLGLSFPPNWGEWADEEFALLRSACTEGRRWVDVAADLKAAGYRRTAAACRSKANTLNLSALRPQHAARSKAVKAALGWPSMRGSDEARDARFVRLVLEEAQRLGLARQSDYERRAA